MSCRSLFVLLVIILSVFLPLTASDYPFSIFIVCSGIRLAQFGLLIDGTSPLCMKEKKKMDKEKGTVSSHGDAEDLLINVSSYDCMTLLVSY